MCLQVRVELLACLSCMGALMAQQRGLGGVISFLAHNTRKLLRQDKGVAEAFPVTDSQLLLLVSQATKSIPNDVFVSTWDTSEATPPCAWDADACPVYVGVRVLPAELPRPLCGGTGGVDQATRLRQHQQITGRPRSAPRQEGPPQAKVRPQKHPIARHQHPQERHDVIECGCIPGLARRGRVCVARIRRRPVSPA